MGLPSVQPLDVHLQVRKEVEGSFFLIEKTLSPFHQIIILNKKNAGGWSWTSYSVS